MAFFFLSFSLLPNNYKSSHFLLFIFFYIFSYYFLSFYFLSKIILLIYLQATILQHPSSPSHSNINTHITTFMSFQQLNFPEIKFLFQKFNSISEIYFFQYIYIFFTMNWIFGILIYFGNVKWKLWKHREETTLIFFHEFSNKYLVAATFILVFLEEPILVFLEEPNPLIRVFELSSCGKFSFNQK